MTFPVKLIQRKQLCTNVFELVFTRPEGLKFRPGQHLRFHYQGCERDYTLVCLDTDSNLRICVKQEDQSGFSAILTTCDIGTALEVSGPHGYFIFHSPGPADLQTVFVGTGTGIAPFVAFAKGGAADYILLQGARTREDLIYREVVSRSCQRYVPCLSQPPNEGGDFFQGRVTDYLENQLPRGNYQFYLCGQGKMIQDAMEVIDEKFSDSRVFAERFS